MLVVSHGNTLRTLIKHLDGIGDDEIAALEIPNGVPMLYDLEPGTLWPLARGGRRMAGEDAWSGTRHSSTVPPSLPGPARRGAGACRR